MRNHPVTRSADPFCVLADPTRRAVLDLLSDGGRAAGQIAQSFPVSRPAISKHLRLLLRANLVLERRRGRHRVYELNPQPLKTVDQWLARYRVFWQEKLGDLKTFVELEQTVARSTVETKKVRAKRKTR